ncbi:MAG: hypothetical protein M3N14_06750 [Bacteroidota bacterium]|nr:hypothetical protein [Bacteroidota bacterium]
MEKGNMNRVNAPKPAGKQPIPLNDGMNTPVRCRERARPVSASEAALFKQAEKPLGEPDKD